MAAADTTETGYAKIYDSTGRTVIPKRVRENLDWEKGDELKFVSEDGEMKVVKVDGN
jgi:AbrB family looped-hinge helix DNA binding protein